MEAAGESFELAVGYAVEESEGGEELDVCGGELVGASFFSVVHGVELCLVVLYEAQFEDEFSSSDAALVCFSPVGGHVGTINVNAK